MEQTWGTPETKPPEEPADPEPVRLCTAHFYLIAATAAVAVAIAASVIDNLTTWDTPVGVHIALATTAAVFGLGWIVRSAESRVRRSRAVHMEQMEHRLTQGLAELTSLLRQVSDEVKRQRITYLPAQGRQAPGQTYRSVTAGQDATVPLPSPADVAATREQVRQIVAEEVKEQRAQLYAEGYVDGVARRQEGTTPS